jgi:Protein of unknown function (DUF3562)
MELETAKKGLGRFPSCHQTVIFPALLDARIADGQVRAIPASGPTWSLKRDRACGSGREQHGVGNHVDGLYSDDDQRAVSESAIESLAREMSRPVAEVKDIYEGEFARLREGARIHDYLILFASRSTRDVLAHGRR